ncbi:hypothetical protein [Mesorhizobium sp. M0977]|uniref:hypothetical protein n=1 Tax=Mesorhizobium sp. M0977 TaxID=2957039 RepID=UPI00333E0E14
MDKEVKAELDKLRALLHSVQQGQIRKVQEIYSAIEKLEARCAVIEARLNLTTGPS